MIYLLQILNNRPKKTNLLLINKLEKNPKI